MNTYIFMATHLPSLQSCLKFIFDNAPELAPFRVFLPETAQADALPAGATLISYGQSFPGSVINPEGSSFVVVDPLRDLPPQLEELADLLRAAGQEPARLVTVVDCAAAEQSPALRDYLDACIFCSDLVLLGNRKGAGLKFVRDFAKSYERKCYPCHFLMLKENGSFDPLAELLIPEPRRLTRVFDGVDSDAEVEIPGLEIEASFDIDADDELDPAAEAVLPDLIEGKQLPDVGNLTVGFG